MNATPSPEARCTGCNRVARPYAAGLNQSWMAHLFNVGWRCGSDGHTRCPVCLQHGDGVVERMADASDGRRQYALRPVNGSWTCTCQGFRSHGHCKHADAERIRDIRAARSIAANDTTPGHAQLAYDAAVKAQRESTNVHDSGRLHREVMKARDEARLEAARKTWGVA